MKPKKFRVVALVLVAVIIGGAIWLFLRTPEYVATATLRVIPASKADAIKPVAPVAQVEMPKVAAVPAQEETAGSQAADTALVQAELKAPAQDMARVMREKGLVSFMLAYYSPDFIARQPADEVQRMLDDEANSTSLSKRA